MSVGLKATNISRRLPTVQPVVYPMRGANAAVPHSPITSTPNSQPTVKRLPNSGATPFWLRSLLGLQRSLSIMTFCLAGTVLTVYGQTVYSQQLWSQEYEKLEALQRDERQLTAASEVLKNQIAQQAEQPSAGLSPSNPSNTIFLQPAPQRPLAATLPPIPAAAPTTQPPVGY